MSLLLLWEGATIDFSLQKCRSILEGDKGRALISQNKWRHHFLRKTSMYFCNHFLTSSFSYYHIYIFFFSFCISTLCWSFQTLGSLKSNSFRIVLSPGAVNTHKPQSLEDFTLRLDCFSTKFSCCFHVTLAYCPPGNPHGREISLMSWQ